MNSGIFITALIISKNALEFEFIQGLCTRLLISLMLGWGLAGE
jgi:hypothetical protein